MKKILVAVTYHDEPRTTIHKTVRSVLNREILMPDGWVQHAAIFCWDHTPPVDGVWIERTTQETLGGKRNAAAAYARARNYDLIAFLDGDDLFGPSWIPNLCYQHDINLEADSHDAIYHPQWNVLFDPNGYVVREHYATHDPRFDSRDMMFYNPWSALCAFAPMYAKHKYRIHKKSDPRLSFEDWSFNLDTWCDGQEHIVVPDTYHFLRLRQASLGKITMANAPEHTRYFKDPAFIQKTIATRELTGLNDMIDHRKLKKEMESVNKIEPQVYYWRTTPVNQQINTRAGRTVDLVCDVVKKMPFARDVFWMHDHKRIGGAEKALAWSAEFLRGFGKGAVDENGGGPHQVWIDDAVIDSTDKEARAQWGHGITHLLRVWAQEGGGRGLHICNTGIGWTSVVSNPALFDGVQVYLYLFNDDLMFPHGHDYNLDEAGVHSPIYNCAELLDRPNFHIITDSDHFSKRLAEITGLGDKIRKISVPVAGMPNKRKAAADEHVDILWAGRLDHFKGIDELIDWCKHKPKNCRVSIYGDGPAEWTDKLIALAADCESVTYGGRYTNFAEIPGLYDFFLFTSAREGAPNVVREAMASRLRVLGRAGPWLHELPAGLFQEYEGGKLDEVIRDFTVYYNDAAPPVMLAHGFCEQHAITAYAECLI